MNQTILIKKVNRIVLYIAFAVAAIALSLVLNTSAAHAVGGGGVGDPPDIGAGTGGDGDGGAGGEPPKPDPGPKPSDETEGWNGTPSGLTEFTLDCQSWGGSGNWQMSASCDNTGAYVYDNSPGVKRGWGEWSWYGIRTSIPSGTYVTGNTSCAPSGAKSAYAKSWQKQVIPSYERKKYYLLNFGGTAWILNYTGTTLIGEHINMFPGGCVYPETQWSSVTCFWNYKGDANYSLNRTSSFSSWEDFGTRPARGADPRTPTGGTGGTAPSCDRTGTANVSYNLPVDELGYYTVHVTYDYRTYTKEAWVAWGRDLYANWTRGSVLNGENRTWWAYSCRPGTPNVLDGPYNNQSSIPNRDSYTNPGNCPQVTWQCTLDTPTTIGLDRNAVTSGRVSPTTSTSVMRNGEQVDVDFASVRVIDTSTSRDVDVTNGGTAPSIRNLTNISYRTNVKDGSTPFYGKDPNASNQYFKMYNTRGSETKERFNTWLNNNNANRNKALSFNWASESTSDKFAVQRTYRVTAEFYVPAGGSIGTSGASATTNYKWLTGTYDCRDYNGRGTSRVDRGVLTSTSNPVEVIRSVNR